MSKCEGEFLKTFVCISLRMIGIFKSRKWSILYSSVYLICLLIGICGSIIGFLNTRGLNAKIESLAIFCITFANCCVYVTSLLSRRKIKKLLNILQGDSCICSNDILQETGEFANGKILLLVMIFIILTVLFVFPSFIAVLIFRDQFTPELDENLEVIPYWYSCGEIEHHRVVKSVCWSVESKFEYIFKNIVELMICIVEYFASNYFIVLYCIVMAEFYIHRRIFKKKVEFLTKYAEWFAVKFHELKIDEELKKVILQDHYLSMEEEFLGIIKYQQFLKRCVREINITFKTFNDVLIAEYFGALIFAILMIFYKSENAMLFKCIPLFVHETLSLSLLCYFAQIISDSNETISCEFSKIPWYEQDVRFRKMYLMVMTQNYVPIQAKLCNARVLNLQFLLSTFRSLYSILNLLLLEIGK